MAEMAILYDSSLCTACKGCQVACKCWNDLPSPTELNANEFTGTYQNPPDLNGDTRLIMEFAEYEGSGIKPVDWAFSRRSCQHCTDAPCARVCPPGALKRNEETGFVEVYPEKCISCHYCSTACPFDVPRYYGGNGGIINKCTGCPDRIEQGLAPACVSTCQPEALKFGPRSEMVAEAYRRVAVLRERGYADACVYGESEMGGLHVISVLKYGLAKHGAVENPQVPIAVPLTEIARPLAAVGVGAVVLGMGWSFINGIGYKRDELRYDEKAGDTIDVETGEVVSHKDLASGAMTYYEHDAEHGDAAGKDGE